MSRRNVICIILPNDVLEEAADRIPPHAHGTPHSSGGHRPPRVVPVDDDIRRAADILKAGEKVAILVGAGALDARDEVLHVAEALGAGVAKGLLGRAVIPDANIPETEFETAEGIVRLVDFMPLDAEGPRRLAAGLEVAARIEGVEGPVRLAVVLDARPDDGAGRTTGRSR